MMRNDLAMFEGKEKILVWWNISSCPIPPGYDAREVGSRIESALRKDRHSGPLTITAIGEISQTPGDKVLRDLSDTGMTLIHAQETDLETELVKWIRQNPPPAKIMIIAGSRQLQCVAGTLFVLDTKGYSIYLALPTQEDEVPEWMWKSFLYVAFKQWQWPSFLDLGSAGQTTIQPFYGRQSRWSCSVCNFAAEYFKEFIPHLKSVLHNLMEQEKKEKDKWALTTEERAKRRRTEDEKAEHPQGLEDN